MGNMNIISWLKASRPKTLPAAVVPVWLGCALAWKLEGVFSLKLALATLFGAIFIQIATNFFNDLIDAEKGADTDLRLGPARMTAGAELTKQSMFIGALLCLAAAAIISVPLIQAGGWPIVLIGLISFFFAFGYTGGPFPLAYLGLGEIFVILFFGLVAVAGTAFLQLGEWRLESLLLGGQVGLLSAVLISINNLRDIDEDKGSNKNTLAVRLGIKGGRFIILLEILSAAAFGLIWLRFGYPELVLPSLVPLCLGALLLVGVYQIMPSRIYNRFLAFASLQLIAFAFIFTYAAL